MVAVTGVFIARLEALALIFRFNPPRSRLTYPVSVAGPNVKPGEAGVLIPEFSLRDLCGHCGSAVNYPELH